MSKTKLEYVWLDGYKPTQSLRSKTKIVKNFDGTLDGCPIWSFDGSSTEQATGHSSDCLLQPVAVFPDPGTEKCLPRDERGTQSRWYSTRIKRASNN